jgi:hypothetical protein
MVRYSVKVKNQRRVYVMVGRERGAVVLLQLNLLSFYFVTIILFFCIGQAVEGGLHWIL